MAVMCVYQLCKSNTFNGPAAGRPIRFSYIVFIPSFFFSFGFLLTAFPPSLSSSNLWDPSSSFNQYKNNSTIFFIRDRDMHMHTLKIKIKLKSFYDTTTLHGLVSAFSVARVQYKQIQLSQFGPTTNQGYSPASPRADIADMGRPGRYMYGQYDTDINLKIVMYTYQYSGLNPGLTDCITSTNGNNTYHPQLPLSLSLSPL